jgi:hypothetical protein
MPPRVCWSGSRRSRRGLAWCAAARLAVDRDRCGFPYGARDLPHMLGVSLACALPLEVRELAVGECDQAFAERFDGAFGVLECAAPRNAALRLRLVCWIQVFTVYGLISYGRTLPAVAGDELAAFG